MRTQPHNIEAELAVLGSVLIEPEMADTLALTAESFYREEHRHIWRAIERLRMSGRPVELVTVAEELQREGLLSSIGGSSYLVGLGEATPTSSHAAHYAGIVAEKARLRRVIAVCGSAMQNAYDGKASNEISATAVDGMMDLMGTLSAREPVTISEAAIEALARWERTRDDPATHAPLSVDIDEHNLFIIEEQELAIIAAPTSHGKSALALQIAIQAGRKGWPTCMYTLEMPNHQHGARVLAQHSHIAMRRARMGGIIPSEVDRARKIIESLVGLPVWLQDGISAERELLADIRKQKRQRGVRLIIIDYLGIVDTEVDEAAWKELSNLTKRLKWAARRAGVAVIGLHQLNRLGESGEPALDKMAGSYSMNSDPDLVGFIWRESDSEVRAGDMGWFKLAKGRSEALARVPLLFDSQYLRFRSRVRGEIDDVV